MEKWGVNKKKKKKKRKNNRNKNKANRVASGKIN